MMSGTMAMCTEKRYKAPLLNIIKRSFLRNAGLKRIGFHTLPLNCDMKNVEA